MNESNSEMSELDRLRRELADERARSSELQKALAKSEQDCELVSDLARFLAETWVDVNSFVRANCSGEALTRYPMIQGARNQMNLRQLAGQSYSSNALVPAIDLLLKRN